MNVQRTTRRSPFAVLDLLRLRLGVLARLLWPKNGKAPLVPVRRWRRAALAKTALQPFSIDARGKVK
jgi:hypothetical protein